MASLVASLVFPLAAFLVAKALSVLASVAELFVSGVRLYFLPFRAVLQHVEQLVEKLQPPPPATSSPWFAVGGSRSIILEVCERLLDVNPADAVFGPPGMRWLYALRIPATGEVFADDISEDVVAQGAVRPNP